MMGYAKFRFKECLLRRPNSNIKDSLQRLIDIVCAMGESGNLPKINVSYA
jgi:hypothetical protein